MCAERGEGDCVESVLMAKDSCFPGSSVRPFTLPKDDGRLGVLNHGQIAVRKPLFGLVMYHCVHSQPLVGSRR
jgi:hypothetical protein